MRIPQQPPALPTDQVSLAIQQLGRPEVAAFIRRANAEYYHWDELRARPRPEGLSPAAAWALVKFARQADRRLLPLAEPSGGRLFSYSLPPSALATLHDVDRGGGSILAIDGNAASALGQMREQVVISSLMEEAIATSQIEGAATTRKVAKEMLRSNRPPRDRGEQMIANSYSTMRMLREQKDRELSLEFVFEIQASMTRDTLDDPSAAGRFRTRDDEVVIVDVRDHSVIYTPPDAKLLSARVGRLIAFANKPSKGDDFIHPLVKAAVLHFWLAYEHPFVDGNGRTARALLYWFMLKNGYWLFEFLTVSRAIMRSQSGYYRSFLYSEHDSEDLTYSVLYAVDATKRALDGLRDYLRKKQEEQREIARTLRAVPELNHRQRTLLDQVLKNPDVVVTFQTQQRTHNVTYITARSDILGLVDRKLLDEVGTQRPRSFMAAEDLADKLSRPPKRRPKSVDK